MGCEEDFLKELDEWKRDYLSEYCLNNCGSHKCCKSLEITLDEESKVLFSEETILVEGELSFVKPPCPHFDESSGKCDIWDDSRRPRVCEMFPLFYVNGELFLSPQCELVEDINSDAIFALQKLCEKYGVEIFVRY